ncbi:Ribosome maturation factor RimP [Hartmannibacter diazotrophicus]|uniref:Ribosome maturation factor RimP n=1 Tax=Hartmannibacter diazotrophicus TaxID=1482074 RepID=A0A2C9DE95_9HYPH|nr:Ribosome maturation factor RimP [Hartmannibacter diazotrophicus]
MADNLIDGQEDDGAGPAGDGMAEEVIASGAPTFAAPLDEPRLVRETGPEARVAAIIDPILIDLGYRLVRVRLSGMNGLTLQIMAERPDGTMNVEDCEAVSRAISPALDVEDPIDRAYHLEVSSPGMDRILVRKSDFVRWQGHEARIELAVPLNGRKRFRGWLMEVEGDTGGVRLLQPLEDGTQEVRFPLDTIDEVRLVLNDALIKASLKAGKS